MTDDAILSDRPGAIEGLPPRPSVPRDWLMSDLTDSLEEEAELTDDTFLSEGVAELYRQAHPDSIGNKAYFDSLFALQAELIKLQDWVSHHKKKVVVLFEGRDSAGKGGVIGTHHAIQRARPSLFRGARQRGIDEINADPGQFGRQICQVGAPLRAGTRCAEAALAAALGLARLVAAAAARLLP